MRIEFYFPAGTVTAVLRDSPTARAIIEILPLQSSVSTWGDEIYFEIPAKAVLEPDARQVVDPGTVCFWTEGAAIAVPFGPTPVSKDKECRLVSRVNIVGKIERGIAILRNVRAGDFVRVQLKA